MKSLFAISGDAAPVLGFSACDAKDERNLQNSVESKTERLGYEDRGLTKDAKLDHHTATRAKPKQPAATEPPRGVSSLGAQSSGAVEGQPENTVQR